jgi:hypothetical protein
MIQSRHLPVKRSEFSQAHLGLQAVSTALGKLGNVTDRGLGMNQEKIHCSLLSDIIPDDIHLDLCNFVIIHY